MSLPSCRPFLLFLPLLAACSMRGQPTEGADGSEIYAVSQCAACHGANLRGTENAPSLYGLSGHWEQNGLADFFAHPDEILAQGERLIALDQKFSQEMPTYDNLNPTQRTILAAWLLKFH